MSAVAGGERRRRGAVLDLRLLDSRVVLVAGACLLALVLGVASVASPVVGIALPLALVFVAAAFRELALGIVLFTLLAFFQLIPGIEGSGVTLVKLAGLGLVVVWLIELTDRRKVTPFLLRESPVVGLGALAFWLWGVASLLWATDAGAVYTNMWRVGQGILLMLVVYSALRRPEHVRWFAWAFVAGSFLAGAIGLVQGTTDGIDRLVSSAIGDSNYLAAALVPGLVLDGFLFMTTRSQLARTILVALGSVTAISLFMTQSRGGVIGLGAAIAAGLLLSGPVRARVLVAFLIVAAAGISYYTLAAPPEARARITSFSPESSSGRADLWTVALREFEAQPTTGVGGGNFVVVKQDYALDSVNITRLDRVVDDPVVVHNTYLEILSELGWVGFLLFAVVVVGALVLGWRGVMRLTAAGDARAAVLGRGILVATIGMLGAFTFLSAQYEKNLWLLLGTSAALWSIALRTTREA